MSFLRSRLCVTIKSISRKWTFGAGAFAVGGGFCCYHFNSERTWGLDHSPFVIFAQDPSSEGFDVDQFIHSKLKHLKESIAHVVKEVKE